MLTRYSSRRGSLRSVLPDLLRGAYNYDRIAGYFSSSILEVAGEALETLAPGATVRVICNSQLDPLDVLTARAARHAMFREWTQSLPEDISPPLKRRLERLYHFLSTGRLHVRVMPDERFGLLHGKAGVITRADGSRIAFIGSANETRSGWRLNYEIVWADQTQDGIDWVQEEFNALWHDPSAVDLADAVLTDVRRLIERVVIDDIGFWKDLHADPAATVVELPVYRRENGLWAHQKYFVRLAFDLHQGGGARLLLADQVGLGKTVQLALAAKLMALWSGGRVLVLAPKPLLLQWREEIWRLLRLPSAIWTGQGWEDENEIYHSTPGEDGLRRCPRRVGIVSTGLVTRGNAASIDHLVSLDYACVILDEAHHARRTNLGPTHHREQAQPNNLLAFLQRIATRTTSLLLATATPVQLDPIEAWDLLDVLGRDRASVLGTRFSPWRVRPRDSLDLVLGRAAPPADLVDFWPWVRDPFPPRDENRAIAYLRDRLDLPDDASWAAPEDLDRLGAPGLDRLRDLSHNFFREHSPYIRHIIRRTRAYLETTIDPETNEPYLKPVRVQLFGDADDEAIRLPPFLRDAYTTAEDFCNELKRRPGLNSQFVKTLLLRRLGSSIEAGRRTALKIFGRDNDFTDEEELDHLTPSSLQPLTEAERDKLSKFLSQLKAGAEEDPKYRVVENLLLHGVAGTPPWLDLGCIIFSQYYDTARWVAEKLSEHLPDHTIGLYAGAHKSALYRERERTRISRDTIKEAVLRQDIHLLVGTDAASEGLNLQKIGTLINLDLPWNPTRLEQRKGRIQRIGQVRDEVYVYNMRYLASVEDRVHDLLSERLKSITDLFGQLPDTLEDVWVSIALREEQKARQLIDAIRTAHPFTLRYDRIENVDWESCSQVLDAYTQLESLLESW